MAFHADHAVRSTLGSRGKTTRRKATHTVRGAEGAYCAQVKEELLVLPPWQAWQVTAIITYPDAEPLRCPMFRYPTREEAERYIADYRTRHPGDTDTFEIVEVTVRWVMKGSEVVEEVQS